MGDRFPKPGWRAGAALRLCLTVALWAACAGALMPGQARAETRVALVAGNAAYASEPLRNPRHDAEIMSSTLKGVGFDVIEAFDANKEQMRAAIAEFGRRLNTPGTVALFYYAGHGVQLAGENYLVPIDAGLTGAGGLEDSAIALGEVMNTLAGARTALNIVILDACRDAAFSSLGFATGESGLAPEVAPANTMIGYATAPGEIAHDGAGNNSPYTAALAFNIPRPGTTLEEVFRDTRRAVIAATGGTQVPWEHSSLMAAFYFKDKAAEPESSAARLSPDPEAQARLAELEAWQRIKGSADPSAFKAHIARYPNGLFAELAAMKMAQLGRSVAERPWTWEVTSTTKSESATASAAFERAVMLQNLASSQSEWRVVQALFDEAAQAGLPQAMFETARGYDKGRGVTRDLSQAARWYGEAAERDHAGAMVALGTMYEFGDGIEQNLAEALRLYRLAADKGDVAGTTSLAYLLAEGKGAARNPAAARKLYERAAAKGFARAQYNLALLELSGGGGRKDTAAAVAHLASAAQKGHAAAAEELAHLYDEGKIVPRDPKRAAGLIVEAITAVSRTGTTQDIFRRRWSFATKRELQKTLAARGFYSGLKHGFMDSGTRRALMRLAEH